MIRPGLIGLSRSITRWTDDLLKVRRRLVTSNTEPVDVARLRGSLCSAMDFCELKNRLSIGFTHRLINKTILGISLLDLIRNGEIRRENITHIAHIAHNPYSPQDCVAEMTQYVFHKTYYVRNFICMTCKHNVRRHYSYLLPKYVKYNTYNCILYNV